MEGGGGWCHLASQNSNGIYGNDYLQHFLDFFAEYNESLSNTTATVNIHCHRLCKKKLKYSHVHNFDLKRPAEASVN